ncbi:MAG: helix-turn-helix transcriptional regulator [Thaumarchaeota archaeon]|nr:helix-turn-helix transcriptional regulator [Nitrososphaerota archaeon]
MPSAHAGFISRKEERFLPRGCSDEIVVETTAKLDEEASMNCPYGTLLEILGKPHTLAILYGFGIDSPLRFTKIQRSLDLQPKILTLRLQELVNFGLLSRKSYNEIPPRVDYELTQKGKDLGKMFDELRVWSDKYQVTEQPRKDGKRHR